MPLLGFRHGEKILGRGRKEGKETFTDSTVVPLAEVNGAAAPRRARHGSGALLRCGPSSCHSPGGRHQPNQPDHFDRRV